MCGIISVWTVMTSGMVGLDPLALMHGILVATLKYRDLALVHVGPLEGMKTLSA